MAYSREYSIKLLKHENDNYDELYITAGREKKYFVRDTHSGGWYTVCDPLGYCERNSYVSKSVLFHVCDKNGKRLFDSSNADISSASYPCLRVLAKEKWNEVAKKYTEAPTQNNELEFLAYAFGGNSVNSLDNWLLSFQDPDLYGDEANLLPENWIYFREKELNRETLDTFEYLGEKYLIEKVSYQHTVCNVKWTEYYSAGIQMTTEFDNSKIGTMYSKREAENIIYKLLKTVYKGNKVWSMMVNNEIPKYARQISFDDAARNLINGDLHRNHIKKVVEAEKKNHTFFDTQADVKAVYNDVTFLYY